MTTFNADMQQKRDTAADWTSNDPTLRAGEMGWESDTGRFKIGDGVTAWTSLAYVEASFQIDQGDATGGVTLIQLRRDAAADWTSNDPTLPEGVWGLETDTGRVKVGDGATAWTSLGYLEDSMELDGGSA